MLVEFNRSVLLNEAVSVIRDENTNAVNFRKQLERIGRYLSYEASKSFDSESYTLKTPITETNGERIKQDIVILSILRAALPMTNSVFNEFENAALGIVSASRGNMIDDEGKKFDIISGYSKIPSFDNKIVIIVDPMLATGSTVKYLLQTIENSEENPSKTLILCAIASEYGIKEIEKYGPNVDIYAAAIDPLLNENGYIVPGLGDAGDRAFNTLDH